MIDFESDLQKRLSFLHEKGLYRELRTIDSPQAPRIQIDGRILLNFSSNDYLGLANHPAVKTAAIACIERYGAGAGASRLICGSLAPHHELDEALADFKSSEAALAFSTGYAAALGTICALLENDDIIIIDKLVHASIVDAARLSKAKLRVFRHNDLDHLDHLLHWAAGRKGPQKSRILVVTESVFSMDGDHSPLREIVELKNKYGAWLMLDEAHATGLYGTNRRGLAEKLEVARQIEIQMGTLGKALGAAGGFICGSRNLIDYLVNRARSLIFSTAPVPAAAAAAIAGLSLLRSDVGQERQDKLWRLRASLSEKVATKSSLAPSAIIPIRIGNETKAVEAALRLRQHGILIPAIRYPTVAYGSARLRLTLTAAHTESDLEELSRSLWALIPEGSMKAGQHAT